MFEEYLAGILAGCLVAGMAWLMLQWRPGARESADD